MLEENLEISQSIGSLDAADPHDLVIPDQKRKAVANFGGDFTINQKILQLFAPEEIARPAIAKRERRRFSVNRDGGVDGRNVNALAGANRHLEILGGPGNVAQHQNTAAADQLER